MGYQLDDYRDVEFSVALTDELDGVLGRHLDKGSCQEDLAFAYWRPSRGTKRFTAVLHQVVLPEAQERVLQGNVAFAAQYLDRVLRLLPPGSGIALLHSHLGPGWQDMSDDDVVAERDRLGGAVAARTGLPVLGLTRATDGTWSARFWLRESRNTYVRRWAATVRVVGETLRISFHPKLMPTPAAQPSQQATISVWGPVAQADLARTHVGVVGLGSVGSIAAETLSRTGLQQLTYVDRDVIEHRNLDRTLGTRPDDAVNKTPKVFVAARAAADSHTAKDFQSIPIHKSLLTQDGLRAVLDCDLLICCVDRPWPRQLLNALAYAHLIPVIDGGILARVDVTGRPLHVDWRIHTIGPGHRCLVCLGALRRSDVALDMAGLLDDPDYLRGLNEADRAQFGRRNVFAFSLSVAAHQVLQLVGIVSAMPRIGGVGPQRYHAYPGVMHVEDTTPCDPDCEFNALTASASDLSTDLPDSKR